ncbi:MAG: TonB-dependent receptor [Tannerella sp.]|jgi:TonB-linked SusC/RagA family outer membrane protein|nr:TonB-dependent receptor [Tannerella sp.]
MLHKTNNLIKRDISRFYVAFLCLFSILTSQNALAQNAGKLLGTVTDNTGEPIAGVNIVITETGVGTITDADGRFSLPKPTVKASLSVSYIGYITQTVPVGSQTVFNIILLDDTQNLEEVVVVGYGTQKKINLTGAVQNVSGAEITRRNTSNTSVALQGLVPGMSVVQSSGQPGADGAGIVIRGNGSLNSSLSPLILIDGVQGDINNIDLNSIESISVLKDAASASIYGSRASNGVILITTKRAKEEGIKISYNGYAGYNTPTELPEPVDAIGYMEAINIARNNAGLDPQYSQDLINQYKTQGADQFDRYDTNWRDEILKKNAFMHNHSVSISGGGKNINYYANAGYYYQDGQIPNNNYSRMILRVNTDTKLTSWLKLGLDLNIRQSEANRPSIEDPSTIINKAITFAPVFSGINSDGTWGFGQNGDNPIATSKVGGVHNGVTPELGVKGTLQLNPFKGFDALVSYSSRRVEYKYDYFNIPYDTYEAGVFRTTYPTSGNHKTEGWQQSIYNQFNAQASYEKEVGQHYFKLLGGMQTEEIKNHSFDASRKGYNYPGFNEIGHGDPLTATNGGGRSEFAMLSYFGRINYSFANRYLIELDGRSDASSRFTKNNRQGFFPSVSAAWRVSEEAFFEPAKDFINNLKFRFSYGTLGNQDISGYYPYAATLSSGYGYRFNGVLSSGVTQTAMSNALISWEKSTQTNYAVEFDIIKSRLGVSFDYYIRNIDDMLQQLPIPSYVGLGSSWENAGSMNNKGWDLSLSWRDKVGNLSYYAKFNFFDVKNEVTNLYGKEYVGSTTTTREGSPMWSWFGYVADGLYQEQSEIDNSPVYGNNKENIHPGYVRYKDVSGPDGVPDNIIDDNDRQIIGDPFPRYQYSLSLGGQYKGFDASLFIQGIGKKDIMLTGYGARPFHVGRTVFKYQLDAWSTDNRNAEYPILLIEGQDGTNPNNIPSSFWIKSGAYLRLKNVVLGYTLPKSLLVPVKIGSVRIYASGQNLFTRSDAYEGYDPENSVSGGSFYPVMRTFTIGLDINF